MMTNTEQTLRQENAQLKQEIALLRRRAEQSEQAYAQLVFQIKTMQRQLFGRQSERFEADHPQYRLFDQPKVTLDAPDVIEAPQTSSIHVPSHQRNKSNQKTFADHLPRVEIIVPVKDAQRRCPCGCDKKVIGHARHERLHYQAAVFEVQVELREKVACPKGCSGEMITAEKPKRILPKTQLTESLLAHLIVSKFDDRQPFYHLEKQMKQRAGFDLTRQTMARATIMAAQALQPLVNLLKDHILQYDIGALDATTLQVLKEPNRPATQASYAYCFRGGPPRKEAILYEYNATKHKIFVNDWYAGFNGTLHCDGDPFFEQLFTRVDVNPSYCHAHARRKFEIVAQHTQGDGLAKHAMQFYQQLYRIERQAKAERLTPEQRYVLRQQHSLPLMQNHKRWLDEHYPTVLPKSPLGKAFAYSLKFWNGLCAFLNEGRLEIDNNLTEQEIKPLVIARKNFLFANSVAGAHALCVHFSLIRTAKKHDLDPYRYYVAILNAMPHCETVDDVEALLPWHFRLSKVGEKAA